MVVMMVVDGDVGCGGGGGGGGGGDDDNNDYDDDEPGALHVAVTCFQCASAQVTCHAALESS